MKLATEQLDIMVTGVCQAKCPFCVQEATFRPGAADSKTFYRAVERHAADFHALGGRRIVITGGEPMLAPGKVLGTLRVLGRLPRFDLVAMYTNGEFLVGAPRPGADPDILDQLAGTPLTHINLSVHHWDNAINRRLLGRPMSASTEAIATAIRKARIPLRMNAVLQKGALDSVDSVDQYVRWAFGLGAADIYLRELFRFAFDEALGSSRYDPLPYIRRHHVDARPIVQALAVRDGYEYVGQVAAAGRKKMEYELLHVSSGRKVFIADLEIGTESRDVLPYLVLMPDARLYRGWLGRADVLDSLLPTEYPERPRIEGAEANERR